MDKKSKKLQQRYRIDDGKKFRLKNFDPADTAGLDIDKHQAKSLLASGLEKLEELQGKLFAENRRALLLIFQAMDAAGKDSTIDHVFAGVDPQGCDVSAFKSPSLEELDHDFLWRCMRRLPERGRIGIFNRSYYEEVLIVRVHPEILHGEKLPSDLVTKQIWKERFESINALEEHLVRNGTAVLKFFLNVSKEEQKRRFLSRIEEPDKNWKFSIQDVRERACWDAYKDAYEDAIRETATEHAPWYAVPADNKWFTRIVVAAAIVNALEEMGVEYPKLDEAQKKALGKARKELEDE